MKKMNWKRHLKVSVTVLTLVAGATVALASGGGEGHIAHQNAWHDVDTWKVLNFVILALGCFFIARKPVAQFFSSRSKGIEDELTDLEQKKADAKRQLAEYEARFRNLERESEKIVQDYIKQGEDAKKRILEAAEAQAGKLEDMAKRNIEQEFKTAKAALKQEVVDRAMDQAQALIKKSITTQDQNRLVDEYLKKVEA